MAVVATGMWSLAACQEDDDPWAVYEETLKEGQAYLAANAQRSGVVTTASGLQYEVLREGREDGRKPGAGDRVKCHYTGSFINGQVFDSSYLTGQPAEFPLNGVIPGWSEGLQLMSEGAKYRFVLPYNLAYGPMGYAVIPPYAALIFEVELIEVL